MRLPRTSESRREKGFCRLITFVDVDAPPGVQFRGQILSPGAEFDPAALPRPAVLVEFAGRVRVSPVRSPASFRALWLIWRFDFEIGFWVEVVRAQATGSEWTQDFAPIAHRLLHAGPRAAPELRVQPVAARLVAAVERELEAITREERCYVLAALEDWTAAEIVRTASDLTVRRKGLGIAKRSSVGGHGSLSEGFVARVG